MRQSIRHRGGARLVDWHRPGSSDEWVVFLHGAGLDHRVFAGQADAFPAETNLLFCDVRGHGESTIGVTGSMRFDDVVEDVFHLLDSHGIAAATIVGHSMGGNVAQELAVLAPHRVTRMVIVGSWAQHAAMSRADAVRMRVMSSLARVIPWRWTVGYSARTASSRPEVRDYVREAMTATDPLVYLRFGATALRSQRFVAAYEHPVPTLLVRGAEDLPSVLPGIHAGIAAKNPLAVTAVIEGAGHLCNRDDPARFNAHLRAFLAG